MVCKNTFHTLPWECQKFVLLWLVCNSELDCNFLLVQWIQSELESVERTWGDMHYHPTLLNHHWFPNGRGVRFPCCCVEIDLQTWHWVWDSSHIPFHCGWKLMSFGANAVSRNSLLAVDEALEAENCCCTCERQWFWYETHLCSFVRVFVLLGNVETLTWKAKVNLDWFLLLFFMICKPFRVEEKEKAGFHKQIFLQVFCCWQYPKIGENKKWKISFLCQRHPLLTSFNIFVVT